MAVIDLIFLSVKCIYAALRSFIVTAGAHGGVPVSTGMWRRDKRAVAPGHHKTGTL